MMEIKGRPDWAAAAGLLGCAKAKSRTEAEGEPLPEQVTWNPVTSTRLEVQISKRMRYACA